MLRTLGCAGVLLIGGFAMWAQIAWASSLQAQLSAPAAHPDFDLACLAPLGTRSPCDSLVGLPPAERQMALCMLSVAKTLPKIHDPRLVLSPSNESATEEPRNVALEYGYDFCCGIRGPPISRVDLTPLLSPPDHKIPMLLLYGATTHGTGEELDDVNAGMPTLLARWRTSCGLNAMWMFA